MSVEPAAELGFGLSRPLSAWNKPLKADWWGLFKGMAGTAVDAIEGKWVESGLGLIDIASALSLETKAAERAWVLIRNSMVKALADIVKDVSPDERDKVDPQRMTSVAVRIDAELQTYELSIERGWFDKPGSLPLVGRVASALEVWLSEGYGCTAAQAKACANRLPSYFTFALHDEWRRGHAQYQAIAAALDSPFLKAAETERAWGRYRAALVRKVDEPMFEEAFGVREVYVPLRCYHWKSVKQSGKKERLEPAAESPRGGADRREDRQRVLGMLDEWLDAWVKARQPHDSLRVLSGGPGSGKSTTARMLAARVAQQADIPVLFIPLHRGFRVEDQFKRAVEQYFTETGEFSPEATASFWKGPLLLILDGLDELSESGRAGAEVASKLMDEVRRVLDRHADDANAPTLLVLATGREPAVQACEAITRMEGVVLHALPYVLDKDEWKDSSAKKEPHVDQRHEWWRKLGEAKALGYTEMPPELQEKGLDEVTAQPLLNYLVALSHRGGRIDFNGPVNRNEIYADLLRGVWERKYAAPSFTRAEQRGKPGYRPIESLSWEDFVSLQEQIALAVWHGNGRTASLKTIRRSCEDARLMHALKQFEQEADKGISRLLLAFYFRAAALDDDREQTFEFTHKSFGEYLAARRIVREAATVARLLDHEDPDARIDLKVGLERWARTCGPTALDKNTVQFIRDELQTAERQPSAGALMHKASQMITRMLRDGMPMEKLGIETFGEMNRRARNAEEALLVLASASAFAAEEVCEVEWMREDKEKRGTRSGAWISRLRGHRNDFSYSAAIDNLRAIDLRMENLMCLNFVEADLSEADLRHANISHTNLGSANLCYAVLCNADLYDADLSDTNLYNADLSYADLGFADLSYANLENAKLSSADLGNACLDTADLRSADLSGANLSGANLCGAKISNADLSNADLSDADLSDADLSNANLGGATIQGARVSHRQLNCCQGTWIGEPDWLDDAAPEPSPIVVTKPTQPASAAAAPAKPKSP